MTTLEQKTTPAASRAARMRVAATAPRPHVVGAVFRRDFSSYFSNPAGYVFITLFVLVSAWVAFGQPAFFANNLANLDTLNRWMPFLLLFFVPAITMSIWAEERRQGTDELLLTLPARDVEVVLGKFLAALGIYTVALGFMLSHVLILMALGSPDPGVLLATYLGYWLMGALLIAIGMVASLLSANATVAFILGALFIAVPVFANQLGTLVEYVAVFLYALVTLRFGAAFGMLRGSAQFADEVGGWRLHRAFEDLSVPAQFDDFGGGVVTLSGLLYFGSLAALMLYLNMVLLGRRHWAGGELSRGKWAHALARVLAVAVALISLDVIVARSAARADLTFERLHTLSPESRAAIKEIPADRPVLIQAFYSPEVPREYVQTRANLLGLLREYQALGGGKIRLNLIETERYSPQASDAEKQFGIEARRVFTSDQARQGSEEIYLGVAFTSGPEEVVVPFIDRGLPIEYELTRSIRVVSRAKRKKVGILNTDARLLGGFDFHSMGRVDDEWEIVTELKKQYEVTSVSADGDIPNDLDVLLVAQPSSLAQRQIDNLTAYVRKGKPTLLLVDPMPIVNPQLAPSVPKMPPGGMFGGQMPEPKGDLHALMELLGVNWPDNLIVWDAYNPHPQLNIDDREIVFVGRNSGAAAPFNPDEPISSGLQEVVTMFPGLLRAQGSPALKFLPLMETSTDGGTIRYDELVRPGMFGGSTINRNRIYLPSGESYTLAARVKGPAPAEPEKKDDARKKGEAKKAETPQEVELHAIVIADLDLISDQFFELRKRPSENLDFLDFDNVTFVLNCVDTLAGDEAFIGLRKRRPRHRTLEAVEAESRKFIKKAEGDEKAAEAEAKDQLAQAQKRLDEKVEELRNRKDLDKRTKEIMLDDLERVENRRLDVAKANIEDQKRRKILESKAEKEESIRRIQNRIRLTALLLPPLPALLLAGFVFGVRVRRENRGASPNRLV